MRFNVCTLILAVSVLGWVSAFPASTFAQQCDWTYYWVVDLGNWSNGYNWQHEEWGPEGGCVKVPGIPGPEDIASITEGVAIVTAAATAGVIRIGPGELHLSTGSLTAQLIHITGGYFKIEGGSCNSLDFAALARNWLKCTIP